MESGPSALLTRARRSVWARPAILLGLASLLLLQPGCASFRVIDAAGPFELEEDEGLILLHVETNARVESLFISGDRASATPVVRDLRKGTHLMLVAAPAGSYQFHRFESGIARYYLSTRSDRMSFRVEAGQLNYPGLLQVTQLPGYYYAFRVVNRSAMMAERIDEEYPGLRDRYPLRYAGKETDVFLERLEAASQANRVPAEAQSQ